MKKFKNKYRTQSNRWKNWDYSFCGAYFVTICTKNKVNYFGEIIDNKMHLSQIGEIAYRFWSEIPNHFSFVILDEFVVMPNHIHGIIIINDKTPDVETPNVETPKLGVSTKTNTNTDNKKQTHNASLKWKPRTLGVIMNQYKRICTINARKINPDFSWQTNYYDHVIRDNQSYQNIRSYIYHNPEKWNEDDEFVGNKIPIFRD